MRAHEFLAPLPLTHNHLCMFVPVVYSNVSSWRDLAVTVSRTLLKLSC